MNSIHTSCSHCLAPLIRVPSQLLAYKHHFCNKLCHGAYRSGNLKSRLMKSFSTCSESGCWIWKGVVLGSGYGQIRENKKPLLAHRASWIAHNGPIQHGMLVLHKCDVRHCIKPEHLFLGTQSDNMRDRSKKERDGVKYGTGHWNCRLQPQDIESIRRLSAAGSHTGKQLAAMYSVHPVTISNIVLRKTWKHVLN